MSCTVVIIGAGPAGLTAAYDMLQNMSPGTNVIVVEANNDVGGIDKTIDCGSFCYDLGGHRYLSDNPRIINIWKQLLGEDLLTVVRSSKIYYNGKLIDYPIEFSLSVIKAVGKKEFAKILLDYLKTKVHPRIEQSLEDFYINRFGRRLYEMFFKTYTKKVWGRSAAEIPCDWGYQRIGRVSIQQLLTSLFCNKHREKSTTRSFYYPRYGSGQLWNIMKNDIIDMGGEIILNDPVTSLEIKKQKVNRVICRSGRELCPDYLISSMAVRDLLNCMMNVPASILEIGNHLPYRNMIVVGVLLAVESLQDESIILSNGQITKNQWIYVQDPNINTGRIQIFSSWSEKMCREKNSVCLGLEYFCDSISLYSKEKEKIQTIVFMDLVKLGIIKSGCTMKDFSYSIIDKAYPCYWGGYNDFEKIRSYIERISNLYLVGRNGLHEYINTDKAMETALEITDLMKTFI